VCVTWGTFSEGLPEKNLVPDIVAELSELDVEQVVAIKESEQHLVGAVPDAVRVVSGLPLHAVLATCSAVVFHGGGNTMLGSMLEGVPALAISANFERTFNTGHMVEAGAGLLLNPDTLRPGEISGAVRKLLEDPAYRTAAGEVRDEMLALPTPVELVSTLEDIAAGRRVPEKEGVSR
jgi:UDP:flavonoid glycosyltransferase YjiC (YdhE family)